MPVIKTYTSDEEAYRELKNCAYLQSTGQQYIKDLYHPSSNTKIKFKYIYSNYNGNSFIGENDSDTNDFRFFRATSTTYFDCLNSRINGTYVTSTTDIYETEIGQYYVKDITTDTIKFNGTPQTFTARTQAIRLFTSGSDYGCIYYIQIYEGDTLTRCFVPVVMNNVGYLYDTIEHKLYGNDGTGSFTYGGVLDISINPLNTGWVDRDIVDGKLSLNAIGNQGYEFENWLLKGYTQLEYIESTGTQYITIPLTATNNTIIKLDCKMKQHSSNQYVFATANDDIHLWVSNTNSGDPRHGNTFSSYTFTYDRITLELANTYLKVNNDVVKTQSAKTFSSDTNFYLCCSRSKDEKYNGLEIYGCSIYDIDNVKYNFIPVIRHSDGAIGLLDLCEMKFYGNSGTGTFIAGGIV